MRMLLALSVTALAAAPITTTWITGQCPNCKIARDLGRIQFVSPNEAWAIGYAYPPPGAQGSATSVIVHTTDAGHTWTELPQATQHPGDPNGPPIFSFPDAAHGWIAWWNATDEPKLIRTTDAGRTWSSLPNPLLDTLHFFNQTTAIATSGPKFLRTTNAGLTWTITPIPNLARVQAMHFLTPTQGWIAATQAGQIQILRTTDGGRNWQSSTTPAPPQLAEVDTLFFLDPNNGWLTTHHFNNEGTHLFRTTDGGNSWTPDPDPSFQGEGNWITALYFLSKIQGFLFLEQGKQHIAMSTTDGGNHWNKQTLPNAIRNCDVVQSTLYCTAGPGFKLLKISPTP